MAAVAREREEEEPLLPRTGRSSLQPKATNGRCLSCLEDSVAFTDAEIEGHQRLLDMAATKFEPDNVRHEELLRSYWEAFYEEGGEAGIQYSTRSRLWRDLGFQQDDPRTDFRASGYIALRCLLYLAQEHRSELRDWVRESNADRGVPLFSACCINLVGLLLVQLNLNAMSLQPQVRGATKACSLALKNFARTLPESSESGGDFRAFADFFVAAVRKTAKEWEALKQRKPGATIMDFGDALTNVSTAVDYALCYQDFSTALQVNDHRAFHIRLGYWWARVKSALLGLMLSVLRCCSCC